MRTPIIELLFIQSKRTSRPHRREALFSDLTKIVFLYYDSHGTEQRTSASSALGEDGSNRLVPFFMGIGSPGVASLSLPLRRFAMLFPKVSFLVSSAVASVVLMSASANGWLEDAAPVALKQRALQRMQLFEPEQPKSIEATRPWQFAQASPLSLWWLNDAADEAVSEKAESLSPSDQAHLPPQPQPSHPAALSYFSEVAFTGEFNNVVPMIRKWEEDVRIRVHGQPRAADLQTLNRVVAELNGLIDGVEIGFVDVEGATQFVAQSSESLLSRAPLVQAKGVQKLAAHRKIGAKVEPKEPANFDVFFVPESQFSRYEPSYLPPNYGFFWAWSDSRGSLRQAKVLISSDSISQQERSHLIREELTQALGLMQDSYRHADSIFYQNWTTTTQFSALDQQLIKMLYRSDILPGMSQRQALKVLQSP